MTVNLFRSVAEQRERHITTHARAHCDSDEEILEWVRVRHLQRRRDGFLYLTPKRVIVYWSSSKLPDVVIPFEDITAWGISDRHRSGPLLAIQSDATCCVVQMPVLTSHTAHRVAEFLQRFARLAPRPRQTLTEVADSGSFRPDPAVAVYPETTSLLQLARRVVVTVVGAGIAIGGLLISPVPGPWSFPLVLAGLALLASEYDWAKDLLDWAKHRWRSMSARFKARRSAG